MTYLSAIWRLNMLLLLAFMAQPAQAGWVDFHTTNLQVLHGENYKVGDEDRTIITFEHANKWRYGDFFMFSDYTTTDDARRSWYTEFAPRLSAGKITGEDWSAGPLKDVLLAGQYEVGINGHDAILLGVGTDWDLPGFQVAQMNVYQRNNLALPDKGWQVTFAWKRPTEIAGTKWLFEGFADIAGRESQRYHANQLIVPRMLLDVGDLTGLGDNQLFAGVEWQYWHNKFGIDGVTESVPQLQIKWVFD